MVSFSDRSAPAEADIPAANRADVLVIGAGFSGLTAARVLHQAGASVLLLEARDRVGGRIKAGEIAGLSVDLGGMWQGGGQRRLAALASRYGVRDYPTFLDGNCLTLLSDEVARAPRDQSLSTLPPAEQEAVAHAVEQLTGMAETLPPHAPWSAERAAEWDEVTVAEWLNRSVESPAARAFISLIVNTVLCAEPSAVSLLFFLNYLRSCEGVPVLTSAEAGGAQARAYIGGLHQIATGIARELDGMVRLSEPVLRLEQQGSSVRAETSTGVFEGRRAIVALPPPIAARLQYDPPLPHARDALMQRMPMGTVIKAWIAYPFPFWRSEGLNGHFISDRYDFNCAFDVSPPDQPLGLIAGFFDAGAASRWSAAGQQARRAEVLQTLASAFGSQALDPIDYVDADWTIEPWSRGGYGAVAPPGVYATFGQALRDPVGAIHWAGTEAAVDWTGYVEGAIQSGEMSAQAVLRSLARSVQ